MKYEIGDFVSKPVTGICKIENILYLNPQDEKNDKLYYPESVKLNASQSTKSLYF